MSTESQAGEFSGSAGTGLRVFLLGTPVVEWAGQSLEITRRQVRALLYRLAAEERPVPREHLCFLFWPDVPEATARRKLTGLLAHLRRGLPESELLVATGDHVELLDAQLWSDARAFGRLCAVQAGAGAGDALRQAVTLYRGPFLDGFSLPECPEFEEWALLERYTLEQRYLKALATLVQESTASGDTAAAIEYARRYLASDELAEEVHRQLIDLYVMAGDRSAALHQYEQCVLVLERELGVSPLPETQAAYQAARSAQPMPPLPAAAEPAWTTLPSLEAALVGREGALRQLEDAYHQARTGHGAIFMISGEAGVGKSRLMQDFATRLQGQVLLLAGAAYPDMHLTPYAPIVEALRPALLAQQGAFKIPDLYLAEISTLIPELRLLHPGLEVPLMGEGGQLRTRLFEALCNCTLGLTGGRRPLLFCLDDLHWADPTTIDWLIYLGRHLPGSRILLIGTYRREERHALDELRHGLLRQGHFYELELAGLDETSIFQLLQNLEGPAPVDGALARRLAQITGGNPFFVLEILRGFIESGRPPTALSGPADLSLPDTVRDAVELRLERLSASARQVLQAGAVIGQVFGYDLVQRTSGRGEMEAMDGLDELVARQLLVEEADGYRFCHEIIQAVVYQELGHWRRQMLHRRAGEALEVLQPDSVAALARHFERADEPARAARYASLAGQAARQVFAHIEGRAYFERALALLEGEAEALREPESIAANRRLQIQALYDRGWALRLVGDMGAYAEDLKKVARLAELLGDRAALAHLRWREAYTHRWFCRYAEARRAAQEGVRLSQEAGEPLLEAQCWREIGMAARGVGDYGVAQEALEQALALSIAVDSVVHQIHAMGNLATLHWYRGEYQQAFDLSLQALARCDGADLPLERRLPLGDMGAAAAALGDADLARQCLEESLSIARQIADRTQEILCLLHLGWLNIRLKRPAEALEHLQASLALAERIGSCTEQGWIHAGLAEAHNLNGDGDRARQHAQRALALAEASGAAYDRKLAQRIFNKIWKVNL
jgi:DNA-binding SARP family transcriptional activator